MFKCPVCHFWNFSLEGAKYKAPRSFHTGGQQRTKRPRAAIRFHLKKKKIRTCKKQNKVHTFIFKLCISEKGSLQPSSYHPRHYFPFEQIVHAVRGCDTLKTFHFGWRTFTNGGGRCVCGGVTRLISRRERSSILHAGIFLISRLSRVCLSDVCDAAD